MGSSTVSSRVAGRSTGRFAAGSAAACLLTALLVAAAPGAAHAEPDTGIALPLSGASDVVATDDRVFISGGRRSTDIVVTDAAGELVTTIGDLAGPTDLLLSADQQTVYALLSSGGDVVAFDAQSLQETARYEVIGCANSLAQAGRWLFVGYGCSGWGGNIASIDLQSDPATVRFDLNPGSSLYGAPLLTTAANNPNLLFAGELGLSPASVYVYSVSAEGTLTFEHEDAHGSLGSNLRDIAASADGTALITAAGAPYVLQEFPTSRIVTPRRTFETVPYPNAVELSPNQKYVAGGSSTSSEPAVFVFKRNATFVSSYEIGTGNASLVTGALSFSPDSKRLYAVSWDSYGSPAKAPSLHVLTVVR